jgi:hypothetical protein
MSLIMARTSAVPTAEGEEEGAVARLRESLIAPQLSWPDRCSILGDPDVSRRYLRTF